MTEREQYMTQALELAREAMAEGEAVSYTHLDVYKRQRRLSSIPSAPRSSRV